ncbi:H-NS family nucleoid-associated regulatory protein [Paraburkholderia agricolaris]|uniref:H-NS family nucleoid-associated regulatory protein n=1 Tax=Paraburkholderia agricolaris TaxID=2152888 RepID=A0ABW9A413_9BURK
MTDVDSEGTSTTAKKVANAENYVRGPQAPKYRDPKTGATWSGRGRSPAWLASAKDRTAFLIAGAGAPEQKVAVAKKVSAKKAAAKKVTTKKVAAKKSATAAKKTPVKKAAIKKTVAKKAVAMKVTAAAEGQVQASGPAGGAAGESTVV